MLRQGTPVTQAERLRHLMDGRSVRQLARELAADGGKPAETWRNQLTKWLGGEAIGDHNAELLALHFHVDPDYLKRRSAAQQAQSLVEQLERLAERWEHRLDLIEARLAWLEQRQRER